MSKGLGNIQNEILESLQASKDTPRWYRGSGFIPWERDDRPATWRFDQPGWVIVKGIRVKLADSIYDLRACLSYLAEKNSKFSYGKYVQSKYQASFSRAVKLLEKRGALEFPTMVKMIDWDIPDQESALWDNTIFKCSDGVYISAGRQRRFAQIAEIANYP